MFPALVRAATAFAKLPVEAQDAVSYPNSLAFDKATETTRSLKERVGKHTPSFFTYISLTPSAFARLSAFINGVCPTLSPTVGSRSTGNSSL